MITMLHTYHDYYVTLLQDGATALILAAQNGYTEIVKTLVEGGANVNYTVEVRYGTVCACMYKWYDRVIEVKGQKRVEEY